MRGDWVLCRGMKGPRGLPPGLGLGGMSYRAGLARAHERSKALIGKAAPFLSRMDGIDGGYGGYVVLGLELEKTGARRVGCKDRTNDSRRLRNDHAFPPSLPSSSPEK